ncbi:ANTAR domain-containing protein [Streptomyces populi]
MEEIRLRNRARSHEAVTVAQEVLMERYGLPVPQAAFDLLRHASQHANIKLHTLADAVVRTRPRASHRTVVPRPPRHHLPGPAHRGPGHRPQGPAPVRRPRRRPAPRNRAERRERGQRPARRAHPAAPAHPHRPPGLLHRVLRLHHRAAARHGSALCPRRPGTHRHHRPRHRWRQRRHLRRHHRLGQPQRPPRPPLTWVHRRPGLDHRPLPSALRTAAQPG